MRNTFPFFLEGAGRLSEETGPMIPIMKMPAVRLRIWIHRGGKHSSAKIIALNKNEKVKSRQDR